MNDKQLHEILNSLEGMQKAVPPEHFQHKVMNRWHATNSSSTTLSRYRYWAVASLIGFSILNALALYSLKDVNEASVSTANVNNETQFAEEYTLVKTSDYYTFNETAK